MAFLSSKFKMFKNSDVCDQVLLLLIVNKPFIVEFKLKINLSFCKSNYLWKIKTTGIINTIFTLLVITYKYLKCKIILCKCMSFVN